MGLQGFCFKAWVPRRGGKNRIAQLGGPAFAKGQGGNGPGDEMMSLAANDGNGDGSVSLAEFAAQDAAFLAAMDRSGDGVLTGDDFGPGARGQGQTLSERAFFGAARHVGSSQRTCEVRNIRPRVLCSCDGEEQGERNEWSDGRHDSHGVAAVWSAFCRAR